MKTRAGPAGARWKTGGREREAGRREAGEHGELALRPEDVGEGEVACVALDGPLVHVKLRPRRQVPARTRGCERARREIDEQKTHMFPESVVVLRIGSSFGPNDSR